MSWSNILIGTMLLFGLVLVAVSMSKKESFAVFPQGYRGKVYKNTYDTALNMEKSLALYNAKQLEMDQSQALANASFKRNLIKAAEQTRLNQTLEQQNMALMSTDKFIKQGLERVKPASAETPPPTATTTEADKGASGKKEGFRYELGLPLYIGGLK